MSRFSDLIAALASATATEAARKPRRSRKSGSGSSKAQSYTFRYNPPKPWGESLGSCRRGSRRASGAQRAFQAQERQLGKLVGKEQAKDYMHQLQDAAREPGADGGEAND